MRVETVRGAMAVDGLGTALIHEHVFVHGCDAELRARVAARTFPASRSDPHCLPHPASRKPR